MPQITYLGYTYEKQAYPTCLVVFFTQIFDFQSHRQRSVIFDILPYNSLNIAFTYKGWIAFPWAYLVLW